MISITITYCHSEKYVYLREQKAKIESVLNHKPKVIAQVTNVFGALIVFILERRGANWNIHVALPCDIVGLVQVCIISSALAIKILQSCTKPSICFLIRLNLPWIYFTNVNGTMRFTHQNDTRTCTASYLMASELHVRITRKTSKTHIYHHL